MKCNRCCSCGILCELARPSGWFRIMLWSQTINTGVRRCTLVSVAHSIWTFFFTHFVSPSTFSRICSAPNPAWKVFFTALETSSLNLTPTLDLPPPSESAKRERECRRSSFSNALGSPVSAAKGEKRTPSHGVWSLASHRESWRSNLSFGTCLLRFIFHFVHRIVQQTHAHASDFTCIYWHRKHLECDAKSQGAKKDFLCSFELQQFPACSCKPSTLQIYNFLAMRSLVLFLCSLPV